MDSVGDKDFLPSNEWITKQEQHTKICESQNLYSVTEFSVI